MLKAASNCRTFLSLLIVYYLIARFLTQFSGLLSARIFFGQFWIKWVKLPLAVFVIYLAYLKTASKVHPKVTYFERFSNCLRREILEKTKTLHVMGAKVSCVFEKDNRNHFFFTKIDDIRQPKFFWKRKTTSTFLKMEVNLKKIIQPKTIKSKSNTIFENRRRSHFFLQWKTTSKKYATKSN